ncbi:MAG: hypothetical protein FJ313_03110, partial [Gemmatimonadetes bacterium]|nr:hypothetical protein [Gemmatimonadota bacterium]
MDTADLRRAGLDLLEELSRYPAAPYHEQGVAAAVGRACEIAGLEARPDRYGNLLVTLPGRRPTAPGIAFVAHMDHPGFEVTAREGAFHAVRALGSLPPRAFEAGTRVWITTRSGERLPGRVRSAPATPHGRAVLIETEASRVGDLPCAAGLDLPDFELDGDVIRMRAADDLAGCAAVVVALREAATTPRSGSVYGLFTRAEEVGLVGARLAAGDGLLPPETTIVSIESSRALPGAEIGRGPVIRTGDRATTFDREAEAHLLAARERLAERHGGFDCQRQLMSGGLCEASAFAAFGYPVTGVAFPLGNYHNNGADGAVAAEFIDAG